MVETVKSKREAVSPGGQSKAQPTDSPEDRTELACRTAAAILEVLAGNLRPADAAAVLDITTARYYVLEERAIKGLVEACEPVPIGPTASPRWEIARLEKRCAKLEQDLMRYQALTRAAQRAVGMNMDKASKGGNGGKRTRRPTVRALKAAKRLKAKSADKKDKAS